MLSSLPFVLFFYLFLNLNVNIDGNMVFAVFLLATIKIQQKNNHNGTDCDDGKRRERITIYRQSSRKIELTVTKL